MHFVLFSSRCFSRSDHLALHMKRHIWGHREGWAGVRKKQERIRRRRSRRRRRKRRKERGAIETSTARLVHPVQKHSAAMMPGGQHIHLSGPRRSVGLMALTWRAMIGGERGVAKLLFFLKKKILHIHTLTVVKHLSLNASSRWPPDAVKWFWGIGHCQTNIYLTLHSI